MKELTAATGEPLGTEPVRYWPSPVEEAAGLASAHPAGAFLKEYYEALRSLMESCPLTSLVTPADTWGDVDIRDLRTLEFKSKAFSEHYTRQLMQVCNDRPTEVFASDAFQWFHCQDPEPNAALGDEYPEWEWIQAREDWLREKYAGLWIAVLDDRVVAVAESEIGVLEQAAERGYKNTFTYYVPSESESPVVVVVA